MPTTPLVFSSFQRGMRDSPSMYTAARMNASMNVKKAMPTITKRSGRERNRTLRLFHSGW